MDCNCCNDYGCCFTNLDEDKRMKQETFMRWFMITLALFTIYLGYQVILIISGGSWNLQSVLLGLSTLMVGLLVKNNMDIGGLKTGHSYLRTQIRDVALDLKEHKKEATENFHKIDLKFNKIDNRLEKVDSRLEKVDSRLNNIDLRLSNIEAKL